MSGFYDDDDELDKPFVSKEIYKPYKIEVHRSKIDILQQIIYENTELLKNINKKIHSQTNKRSIDILNNERNRIINEIDACKEDIHRLNNIKLKKSADIMSRRGGTKRRTKQTKRRRKTNKKSKRAARHKTSKTLL
jgi:predicted metallo-beta-lactamase superfamily hydrolase